MKEKKKYHLHPPSLLQLEKGDRNADRGNLHGTLKAVDEVFIFTIIIGIVK